MSAIAGGIGIVGVVIVVILVVVVAILGFLMPLYVYAINTKMYEMLKIQKDMLKKQAMIADSALRLAANSYDADKGASNSPNSASVELLADISNSATRNTELMQEFLSRLES